MNFISNFNSMTRGRGICRVIAKMAIVWFLLIYPCSEGRCQELESRTALTFQEFFPGLQEAQGVLVHVIEGQARSRVVPGVWRTVEKAHGLMAMVRVDISDVRQRTEILFLVVSRDGLVHSRYREVRPFDLPKDNFMDSTELRERFAELQKEYRTLKVERAQRKEEKGKSLREARVRSSLMRLASLGARENENVGPRVPEMSRVQLPFNEELLGTLTDKVRTTLVPRNIAAREQNLEKQLQELSLVSVRDESELMLDGDDGFSIGDKMRLIEQTRYEDISLLEEQLASFEMTPEL